MAWRIRMYPASPHSRDGTSTAAPPAADGESYGLAHSHARFAWATQLGPLHVRTAVPKLLLTGQ